MSCNCGGTMKWIGGLFTGAVLGAAAALLLAPKSGEETRSDIIETVQDKYYEAYDAVLGIGEKISNQIADLKDDFKEWSAKAKKENDFEFDDEFEDVTDAADDAETEDAEEETAEDQPEAESETKEDTEA